jgi:hypothetical protein
MHPVHHTIRPWYQKGTTLKKPGAEIEKFLPTFTRRIHLMGSIPMQKEGMEEKRQEPVREEKYQNRCHLLF